MAEFCNLPSARIRLEFSTAAGDAFSRTHRNPECRCLSGEVADGSAGDFCNLDDAHTGGSDQYAGDGDAPFRTLFFRHLALPLFSAAEGFSR